MNKKIFTYKKSGVNIRAADKFVDFISTVSSKKRGKKRGSGAPHGSVRRNARSSWGGLWRGQNHAEGEVQKGAKQER